MLTDVPRIAAALLMRDMPVIPGLPELAEVFCDAVSA
jgi:hypothetical protein